VTAWSPAPVATDSAIRLEITAVGDEMNEAARIEQSASGGQLLASKPLLERLDEGDATALCVDPARIAYHALGDIKGVSAKAKRDAGSIAVADVSEIARTA
jgi:class 3 adenylate cyclase